MTTSNPTSEPQSIDSRRQELGLTQVELADLSGIPRTTLMRKLRNPGTFTLDELAALSVALNADYWLTTRP